MAAGCHVVETSEQFNQSPGSLPMKLFPLRMRPGYEYVMTVAFVGSRMLVYAVERDETGRETGTINAAAAPKDLEECRAWTPHRR